MVQHLFKYGCISVFRNSLVVVRIIIIIIIETNRQALQNACRQLTGFASPLLFGITIKKGFIQSTANKLKRLFLKIGRFLNAFFSLLFYKRSSLGRVKTFSEKLVNGVEVYRH